MAVNRAELRPRYVFSGGAAETRFPAAGSPTRRAEPLPSRKSARAEKRMDADKAHHCATDWLD